MRKTGFLILLLPLLASCGPGHATGEKRYHESSASMEPTLRRDSTVTAKVVQGGQYQPVDGDIVVFRPPSTWDPESSGRPDIYRVVAIAGETIECCDGPGRLERNGKPLDEPYVAPGFRMMPFDKTTVPAGQLFVLGDNRISAADSGAHGPLPADSVIGVVKTG